MYSEDDKIRNNYQLYDDSYEEEDNSNNDNRKSIIIKIIIIIACVILLIWLISLLKGDGNSSNNAVAYNPAVHNDNITTTRLAAERYFFINGNLPQGNIKKTVTLKTLIDQKLGKNLVDSNNKVCDNSKSTVSLNKESSYVMRINLSCSTNEKEEIFHYDAKTHICLDCDGKTYMDKKEEEQEEPNNKNDYSCTVWSDWTTNRVYDSSLEERTRTLVRAIKKGKSEEKVSYGEWSDWSTTRVDASDKLEVETRTESGRGWSREKQTTEKITESSTVKIISETKKEGTTEKYCPSGFTMQGDQCYKTGYGKLGYREYNSGSITNKSCGGVKTEKNSSGDFELVYQNCSYTIVKSPLIKKTEGETIYTYKTLSSYNVTYYRYRTVNKELIKEDDIITDEYYEENNLPSGYEKYSGSEKKEYSYKLKTCVK